MTYEVDPIDRDAHRRWLHIPAAQRRYEAEGKWFPPTSPIEDNFLLQNNDTASNQALRQLLRDLREGIERGSGQNQQFLEGARNFFNKMGEPRVGQDVMIRMRHSVWEIIKKLTTIAEKEWGGQDRNRMIEEATESFLELVTEHEAAAKEIEEDIQFEKEFFRSQLDRSHEKISQADLLIEMHTLFKKQRNLPPLDQDQLAPFRDKPAVQPRKHGDPWGYENTLYRSIAIDGFGDEYLLGVFTSERDAKAAYDSFYQQYVDLKIKQQDELSMASKRESARYESEIGLGHEKVNQMVETARAKYR